MTTAEYIAGLFDGEGHVSITEKERRGGVDPKLQVKITNTHLPVLLEIQQIYGGTLYAQPKAKETYLQVYVISFTVEKSKQFLRDVLPFLIIKKEQAEIALLFAATVYRRGKTRVSAEEKNLRADCREKLAKLKRMEFPRGWIQYRQLL